MDNPEHPTFEFDRTMNEYYRYSLTDFGKALVFQIPTIYHVVEPGLGQFELTQLSFPQ